MKRLLLLTFFIPAILLGQDSTTTKHTKIFIGINFSPDYSYFYITRNNYSISNYSWSRGRAIEDSIFEPTFGYTTGFDLYYQVSKLVSIKTGVQYSHEGYQTIPIATVYDFNRDPVIATNYIYLTYLDFPLQVNFTFGKRKLQFIASAGGAFNYLLKGAIKTVAEKPTSYGQTLLFIGTSHYSKTNILLTAGLGLKYNLTKRINVQAEPTFRYGLLNAYPKTSYEYTHLWSAGLNIGFNCAL